MKHGWDLGKVNFAVQTEGFLCTLFNLFGKRRHTTRLKFDLTDYFHDFGYHNNIVVVNLLGQRNVM